MQVNSVVKESEDMVPEKKWSADLLEPIEQSTVTEVVAKRLIALLSDGVLRPGDKLPPERELAQSLGVGRTTVREALKLLTLGGLLEARRGDGTYVRTEFSDFLSQQIQWPALLSLPEVEMIVEVREGLEVKAARLAAERATPEDIERISIFQELRLIEGRDVQRETELDLQFHEAIATASHNSLLSDLMFSLQNVMRQYVALSNQLTESVETTVCEHEAIYDAIVSKNPNVAEKAMIDHLACSKSWILNILDNEANHTSPGR